MDPFLRAHQVGPILYDLSGGIYPSNIRDQILRAYMFVQRALDSQLLGPDKSLLVIGAGAAGATAAMAAAEGGVQTVLVERKRVPFSAQFGAMTRFVCPTQYDWPCNHWNQSRFPWTDPEIPLKWRAGRASVIAGIWRSRLNHAAVLNRNLNIVYKSDFLQNYKIRTDALGVQTLEAYFDPPLPREPLTFSMAISCTGFGSEKCTVKNYTGYSFWDVDKFEHASLGVDARRRSVLISGGGDGALQDFIRIATNKKCAADIYKLLPYQAKVDVERRIYSAEDQAHRSYMWGTEEIWPHDHRTHEWLHKKYREVINDLVLGQLGSGNYWPAIVDALDKSLKDDPSQLRLKLAFPCTHFSQCYPLNRFLVLLLAEYFERRYNLSVLHPNTKVVEVVSADQHSCRNHPPDCYGREHEILYVPATCETFKNAGADRGEYRTVKDGPYNVVVIRHGIETPRVLFQKRPPVLRQPLPYFLEY